MKLQIGFLAGTHTHTHIRIQCTPAIPAVGSQLGGSLELTLQPDWPVGELQVQ